MTNIATLNDGTKVLGVVDRKYGLRAKTFINYTQAKNAASVNGGGVMLRGRVFFVIVPQD